MPDHDALIRREFSRQAESLGNAALFNDAGVPARLREAAQIPRVHPRPRRRLRS